MESFLVYTSMGFNVSIDLCNHYHCQDTECCITPENCLMLPLLDIPTPIPTSGN